MSTDEVAGLAPTGDGEPRCLVCHSTNAAERYRITRFQVMGCRDCAQIFLHPLPSEAEIVELFRQLYTSGEGSVPELKDYYQFTYHDEPDNPLVQQYERHLELIERHHAPGRLLDLGCGTGLFLAVARRRGWEPFGVDESREATDWARDHFGLDPWVGSFESFAGEGRSFDVITGWDVIEHSRDPVALLEVARECLAPGGFVALSTPNQRSILDAVAGAVYRLTGGRVTAALEKFYIEQHFLYFTPETLADAARRAGLSLEHVERELTDLRRLTLAPPTRFLLRTLFAMGRMTGLENRIFAIARHADA
jgi:2-polyprenyl-3-methyl-5-hydroxy-6-metoxy-1,4-benzoquinol methylase